MKLYVPIATFVAGLVGGSALAYAATRQNVAWGPMIAGFWWLVVLCGIDGGMVEQPGRGAVKIAASMREKTARIPRMEFMKEDNLTDWDYGKLDWVASKTRPWFVAWGVAIIVTEIIWLVL